MTDLPNEVGERPRPLERRLQRLAKPDEILDPRPSLARSVLESMRPHQWAKNLLLFVPMVVGHRFDWPTLAATGLAFIAFCLVASAVYVVNDLSDLDADRRHPLKRRRPCASGALPVQAAAALAAGLLAAAGMLAFVALPRGFLAVIAGYFAANVVYSLFLKRRPILDVVMLASMYVVRLEAGGLAGGIPLSPWLLAFSLFFFTSLAFAKRHAELQRIEAEGGRAPAGRGYMVADGVLLAAATLVK